MPAPFSHTPLSTPEVQSVSTGACACRRQQGRLPDAGITTHPAAPRYAERGSGDQETRARAVEQAQACRLTCCPSNEGRTAAVSSDGSGLLRYGKLQVGQAVQLQPTRGRGRAPAAAGPGRRPDSGRPRRGRGRRPAPRPWVRCGRSCRSARWRRRRPGRRRHGGGTWGNGVPHSGSRWFHGKDGVAGSIPAGGSTKAMTSGNAGQLSFSSLLGEHVAVGMWPEVRSRLDRS
jgi:hypothetical protein